jgi:hypothetical protein
MMKSSVDIRGAKPGKAIKTARSRSVSPACVGIFPDLPAALEALRRLRQSGLKEEAISLFSPESSMRELAATVPTSDTEQGGMGPALAGSIFGALGLGVGVLLFVPGLGPVTLLGALAAGLLGAGSAAAGAAVGAMLERKSLEGLLPVDELYLYEDALAQGRSIVIATPPTELEQLTKQVIESAGAESVNAARENWWVGIRDARKLAYESPARRSLWDDPDCRRGFELGLRHRARGLSEKEGRAELERELSPAERTEALLLGYEEGCAYRRPAAGVEVSPPQDHHAPGEGGQR